MKINIGISSQCEIPDLITNGADEFHCGLLVKGLSNNHRPNLREYNFTSLDDLRAAIITTHESNKKIFFLLNEMSYPPTQCQILMDTARQVKKAGIDGFVVSNLSLTIMLRELGMKIILSSTCPIFNSHGARVATEVGASRIVLPQQISHQEVKYIRESTKAELEILYLKASFCLNIDGLCKYHNRYLFQMGQPYDKIESYPCFTDFETDRPEIKSRIRELRRDDELILTDFYHNFRNGVDVLKIGSRGFTLQRKIALLDQVRHMMRMAADFGEKDFLEETLPYLRNPAL